jgi:hypothetical protein
VLTFLGLARAQLREMTLHPALRNGGMQTLMDVVSEARLRKWAEDCQKGNGARSSPFHPSTPLRPIHGCLRHDQRHDTQHDTTNDTTNDTTEQLRLRLEEVEHHIVNTQREIDSVATGFEVKYVCTRSTWGGFLLVW